MTAPTPNAERGRLAMHVLVDILPSLLHDPDDWQVVIDTAKPRLAEVEAIGVRVHDGPDDEAQVELDAAPLILGGTKVIDRLVRELAVARGLDPLDVVVQLREWIDHDLGTSGV